MSNTPDDMIYVACAYALDELESARKHIAALEAQLAGLDGEVAILTFARIMAMKLHTAKNEAKGDWRRDPQSAVEAIKTEWYELRKAAGLDTEPLDRQAVLEECADVALWAMICADRHIPLCDHDGRGQAK